MNQIITRRKFCQLVAASYSAAMFASLAKKTLAQEAPPLLYGVSAVSGGVVLQSLDLTTDEVQDLSDRTVDITLEPNERLSGFTVLPDNTLVLATAPTTSSIIGNPANLSRLIFVDTSPQTLAEFPGLGQRSTIESLLATQDGQLLSIVSLNQGTPPFRRAYINRQTGKVTFINELSVPSNQRLSNLTQGPDGTIYATSIRGEGGTSLVQLDLEQGQVISLSQLSFNNRPLRNDVSSLACSPSNQLYALGNPAYQRTNSVFTIDVNTGAMARLRKFDVDEITFA